jgi:methylglutaconyl-CoA hydratase
LNRPEVRNAFNEELIEDLKNAFQAAAAQEDIRVIVLRGNGPVFCAGGDLNWLKKGAQQTYQENLEGTRSLAQMFAILNECPKPVIGAIQGAAIGGGVGLVSICDIAIATNETQFSLSEVKLGIVPACIGPFVVAKIGASHARGLFISAERFQGQRAKEMGLIHEVVPDQGALEKAIEKMISSLLKCAPKAMAVAKQLVLDLTWPERRARLEDPLDSVAKTLADVRLSKEGQEGVHAFLEKRKPEWIKNA